jgi:DNA (cytosine-5)-methyltransferase 1
MIDVELFSGAGGMAVGLDHLGFSPAHLYEWDKTSCQTLHYNVERTGTVAASIVEGDVRVTDWRTVGRDVRLLAAGAPCQPFSLAGRHQADQDGRNLFPEVFRAVAALRPSAVLLENVKGLLRQPFRPYFEYILRQLEFPSLRPKKAELWQDHDARLRQHQCSVGYEPEYIVSWRLLDAADFGVPQTRRRVFIVGLKPSFGYYNFPKPTHSAAALEIAKRNGEYWARHDIKPSTGLRNKLQLQFAEGLPWRTVRDAIRDLPPAAESEKVAEMNHWAIPGARAYPGHEGSMLDLPSKTIKAGVHGVPGGENTVIEDAGKLRYYTLRELARIQTFPDEHFFVGARTHVTRQIGNAVPCDLAEAVGRPLWRLVNK